MDSPTATVLDLYDDRNRRYNDARLSPELPNYYNDALKEHGKPRALDEGFRKKNVKRKLPEDFKANLKCEKEISVIEKIKIEAKKDENFEKNKRYFSMPEQVKKLEEDFNTRKKDKDSKDNKDKIFQKFPEGFAYFDKYYLKLANLSGLKDNQEFFKQNFTNFKFYFVTVGRTLGFPAFILYYINQNMLTHKPRGWHMFSHDVSDFEKQVRKLRNQAGLQEEEYNERFSIVKLPTKKEEYTKLEEEITSQTENNERVDLVAIDMQYKSRSVEKKEKNFQSMFFKQICLVCSLLKNEGTAVMKIYTTTLPLTVELLFITYLLFEEISLVKPLSSSFLSLECFIIGFNFRKEVSDALLPSLLNCLETIESVFQNYENTTLIELSNITKDGGFMNFINKRWNSIILSKFIAEIKTPSESLSDIRSIKELLSHWSLYESGPNEEDNEPQEETKEFMENVNHEIIIKKGDRGKSKMEIIPKQNNNANLINRVMDYSAIDLNDITGGIDFFGEKKPSTQKKSHSNQRSNDSHHSSQKPSSNQKSNDKKPSPSQKSGDRDRGSMKNKR